MSTTATTSTAAAPGDVLDVAGTPAVPFTRLVSVELRKALDTRGGRWFTASIIALALAVVVIFVFAAPAPQRDFGNVLAVSGTVLAYFLPVLVILMVTSEWSQRTGLVTFTLEPHRPRVVGAKLCAALILGVLLIVAAFVVAVIGTLIHGSGWSIETNVLVNGFVIKNLIGILTGFAIGMLLMNSAAGIVTYFIYSLVLPIAVNILSAFQQWFADLAPWIEFNTAQQSLFQGDYVPKGEELGQLITSGLLWLVLPFVIGLLRLLRAEPK